MSSEDRSRFFNRELSWLEFNDRVLAEAMDPSNPILERLKFAGIVSSNFDEFFMVRLVGINEADSIYKEVRQKAFSIMQKRDKYCEEVLFPDLNRLGISRITPSALSEEQYGYVESLFNKEILPLLTPLALRKGLNQPVLSNLSLYCVVKLRDSKNPLVGHLAVIEMPRNIPRVITLPEDKEGFWYILVEDIVSMFAKNVFRGYEIIEHGFVRVTRSADLSVDEEKDEDFAKVMSDALTARHMSYIVRFEFMGSDSFCSFFSEILGVHSHLMYRQKDWIDLKAISQIAFHPGFEKLKDPKWVPCKVPEFSRRDDLWEVLKSKDIMVLHPYQSFDAVLRFLNKAADDPDVLSIKQTLYRAGRDSSVIQALEKAAQQGKQVTVIVELKARFDEERNIEWARRLENAGATILYGVTGLKTHAKACLVVRRGVEGVERFVHLSTGNYNEKTSEIYSDIGLFTSRAELTKDIAAFFNVITGFSEAVGFSKISVSPQGIRRKLHWLILREIMRSKNGEPAMIFAKMNSLSDPGIIEDLYKASKAGVKIKLNVRGICCLKPGVKGLSDNIEVTSIVDKFLEHARIFCFLNAGEQEVYLSSADWMPRNLDRRVEIMFPVEERNLIKDLAEMIKAYFNDNVKSWTLRPDGSYVKNTPLDKEKTFRVQEHYCLSMYENTKHAAKLYALELKPKKPKRANTSVKA